MLVKVFNLKTFKELVCSSFSEEQFTLSLYYDLLIFLLKSAIIYLNEEGRGRSAHG